MTKETTTKTSKPASAKSALALALLAGVSLAGVSLAGIDSASAMNPRTFAAPTVRAKAGGVPMARPNMSHIRPLNPISRQAPRNLGAPIARPNLSHIRPLNPISRQAAGNPGVPMARPDLSHIRPLNPISRQAPRNLGAPYGYGGNGAYGNARAPYGIPSNGAFASGGAPNGLPGPAGSVPRNGPHNGIGNGTAAGLGNAIHGGNGLGNGVGNGPRVIVNFPPGLAPLPGKGDGDGKGVGARSAAGSDVSTALNPSSASSGKGREDVGSGSGLQIPAAIAELYRLTNGNLAALSQFREFADWIRNRPDVVPDPLSPNNGGGAFKWPEGVQRPGQSEDDKYGSDSFLNGSWYPSARGRTGHGARIGWVSSMHTVYENRDTGDGHGTTESYYKDPVSGQTVYIREGGTRSTGERTTVITTEADGSQHRTTTSHTFDGEILVNETDTSAPRSETRDGQVVVVRDFVSTTYDADGNPVVEKGRIVVPKEKDSQPAGDDFGGRGGRGANCGLEERPRGPEDLGIQCAAPSRSTMGAARIMPREAGGSGTTIGRRASPSWATDPDPEGSYGGRGHSRSPSVPEGCENDEACGGAPGR